MSERKKYIVATHPLIKTLLNCGEAVEVSSRLFGGKPLLLSRQQGEANIYTVFDSATEMSLMIPDSFLRSMRVSKSSLPTLRVRAGEVLKRIRDLPEAQPLPLLRIQQKFQDYPDEVDFSLE